MTTITGPIFLHSETGTEGGYWATQNDQFITPAPDDPTIKICATCNRFWDTVQHQAEPAPFFTYYDSESKSYQSSPELIEDGQTKFGDEEDDSFNDKWTRAGNEAAAKCLEHGHVWEWQEPHEVWSYEGLVYIETDDVLEIFDPQNPDEIIDTIEVKLIDNGDQYAEGAKDARGMVIHSYPDPSTIDTEEWEKYFFGEYRARLTRNT